LVRRYYLALRLRIYHLSPIHFGTGVFLAIAWFGVAWIVRFSWGRSYLGYLFGLTLFGTMYTHLAAFITLLAHLNVEKSLDTSSSAASRKRKNIFIPTPWRPIQKHKLPPIGGIIQGAINNVPWRVLQLALHPALPADSCRSHHDGILNLPFVSCSEC